jgi:hypothetical protein
MKQIVRGATIALLLQNGMFGRTPGGWTGLHVTDPWQNRSAEPFYANILLGRQFSRRNIMTMADLAEALRQFASGYIERGGGGFDRFRGCLRTQVILGSTLAYIFDPKSAAEFEWDHVEQPATRGWRVPIPSLQRSAR